VINNGLTKVVLFVTDENIKSAFCSKLTDNVSGALRRLPLSGGLFLAGFLAITGSPPFGPFISEFSILTAAFSTGQYWVGGFYLLLLLVVFLGMGASVVGVVLGKGPETAEEAPQESFWSGAPILALIGLVLLLGLYLPAPLRNILQQAAGFLEASR